MALAEQMVGGFGAPIYFTQYDQVKVNSIKKVQGIDHILISFPPTSKLQHLAREIANNLANYKVIQRPIYLQNTKTTQYNLSSVIVVVYFIPQPIR